MANGIAREFIDQLLLRVDIVSLIDSYVPLKKSGNNFTARCPFHEEKSPSFSVSQSKQFYHCFGCGVGGNAISFLMDFNHLDFLEAIDELAKITGMTVPKSTGKYQSAKQDYGDIFEVLAEVSDFYAEQLQPATAAADYLQKRGITEATAKTFSLGFAPANSSLTGKFSAKSLLAGGVTSEKNGRVYDRMQGRLIFPIKDRRRRVVGFGGRALGDKQPKYLNSPETAIFSKSRELYGLAELLEKHNKPAQIIIVEGYMDVLALAQNDIGFAVAVLGTAICKMQIELLWRWTDELVFCFDGDKAGKKATWGGVKVALNCLQDGKQAKIITLPEGEDPDSYVKKHGKDVFTQHTQNAQTLSDYFVQTISEGLDLDTLEGRAQLINLAKPHTATMPTSVFRQMLIERINKLAKSNSLDILQSTTILGRIKSPTKSKSSIARNVIATLLQNPELIEQIELCKIDWRNCNFSGSEVLTAVIDAIVAIQPANCAALVEYFRGSDKEKTINALAKYATILNNAAAAQPDTTLSDGAIAEFVGSLDLLNQQDRDNKLLKLLNSERQNGINCEEKAQLRELLKK